LGNLRFGGGGKRDADGIGDGDRKMV